MATKAAVKTAAFEAVLQEAMDAGIEAAAAKVPTPMKVVEHANPAATILGGDPGPVVQEWDVPQGVCGFAWINVSPGTSSFARYLKAEGKAKPDSYYGGVTVWVSAFGQSYEKKTAYATAYAAVINAADVGVTAYADGRLD